MTLLKNQDSLPFIHVKGARVHNLKNIEVRIPKNTLVVVTGLSGSGKSSLVFDTLYAEGQRRYLEAFGSYIRQFVGELERPDVDSITGISPMISIEQKTTNRNPRSTVGTVTEIYDFFRLLYARIGKAYSKNTGKPMVAYKEEELLEHLFTQFMNQKVIILAPLVRGRKGHYKELFNDVAKKGYLRVRVDGNIQEIEDGMRLDRYKTHDIEAVIDQLTVRTKSKEQLKKSLSVAMKWSEGLVYILSEEEGFKKKYRFSKKFICEDTGISYEEPSPLSFSFNSPYGYCPICKGLGERIAPNMDAIIPDDELSIKQGGIAPLGKARDGYLYNRVKKITFKCNIPLDLPIKKMDKQQLDFILYGKTVCLTNRFAKRYNFEGIIPLISRWFNDTSSEKVRNAMNAYFDKASCDYCGASRLKEESLFFKLNDKNIASLSQLSLEDLSLWIQQFKNSLNAYDTTIAKDVIKEIEQRLHFLLDVGLYYLKMDRPMSTLSGGESQRIRLATQIGSQLKGITYVLDEPSIGLHPRDNQKLIASLKKLRDMGNTVIVVEHDEEIMRKSDYIIDIGPGAGAFGGEIVAYGTPSVFMKSTSFTAQYLRGTKGISLPSKRRKQRGNKKITLLKTNGNNLKNLDVSIPLSTFVVVTGVSGSGKSTLVGDTLYPLLHNQCYRSNKKVLPYGSVQGIEYIDKVIEVDQSPIGRTPRSCPATYSGFFTDIRMLFASLPEAQLKGFQPGAFSFNVKGGRCEICEGVGVRTIKMIFLPDVYLPCDKCWGKRFGRDILEVRYKFQSISDILEMSVDQAVDFFKPISSIYQKIKVLQDVGLGYIKLGQNALTLSGGEAQRIKLSSELVKKQTGKTVYILDEPTTGLHTQDIALLIDVLQQLVTKGNTVLLIEHNLDIIKMADYIIDLGLEGGDGGGYIIAQGTPEQIAEQSKGHTARFLQKILH